MYVACACLNHFAFSGSSHSLTLTVVVLSPCAVKIGLACRMQMMMNAWPNGGGTTPLRSDRCLYMFSSFVWMIPLGPDAVICDSHGPRSCSRPSFTPGINWGAMMLLLTSEDPWIMLLRTIPPHCKLQMLSSLNLV
jgi:hypothetical protein